MNTVQRARALLIPLLLLAASARADVAVLIHGWSANADTWVASGVVPVLAGHGWQDAGILLVGPAGPALFPVLPANTLHTLYRVQLPAEAPLALQSSQLVAVLQMVRHRHPNEPLALVGHSAGGLVARLALVHPATPPVTALITIATPNLGTVRALQGLDVAESRPFFCPGPGVDFMKTMVGGDSYRYLRYSRAALVDLQPVAPGTLIDWLNHQPHPDIAYHAIIRETAAFAGDELVPAASQDLNQVPPLRGRAHIYPTPAGHALNPADGNLLAGILTGS